MRRAWYVWKFLGGRFKGSLRVEQGCDAADRLAARLSKIHGNGGWSYSLSDRPRPAPEFVNRGEGI